MKKLVLTIFMAFFLCIVSFGNNGGLFQRGETVSENSVSLLQQKNVTENDTKDEVPLGSGVLLMTALGTAYAVSKKSKK